MYIGTGSPAYVYALDAATGTERWFTPESAIYSSPAVVDGLLYIGSTDGNHYALDTATGTRRWAFPAGSGVDTSPAVADGVVYFGSSGDIRTQGGAYALDAATGTKKWAYPTSGGVRSSPAVVDGVVYIGSDGGYVYALDAVTETAGPESPPSPSPSDAQPAVRT